MPFLNNSALTTARVEQATVNGGRDAMESASRNMAKLVISPRSAVAEMESRPDGSDDARTGMVKARDAMESARSSMASLVASARYHSTSAGRNGMLPVQQGIGRVIASYRPWQHGIRAVVPSKRPIQHAITAVTPLGRPIQHCIMALGLASS